MTWGEFWAAILPPTVTALVAVITALAWAAVAYLGSIRRKFEESKDREALDSAISRGIRTTLIEDPCASEKQITAGAAKYTMDKGAPDAVKKFDLSQPELARRIVSEIPQEKVKLSSEKPC